MSVEMQDMLHFHLTGKRGDAGIEDAAPRDVCPALLLPYRQLSKLRYDYPLILLDEDDSQAFVDTLSGVVSRLLREIAPEGIAGEQLRQHVLGLELRMRELVAGGFESSLAKLWEHAEKSLLAECENSEAELLKGDLATARFALRVDGQVVDCDDRLPSLLLQHAWTRVEESRTGGSLEQINSLIIGLRNILKVDDLKTKRSRTPRKLKQALGGRYKEALDFELMSELLDEAAPNNRLPADRRRRVKSALSILESQKFFVRTGREKRAQDGSQYRFVFSSASNALKAYNERLPEMANVIKAIAIAELECENAYREAEHDAYFDRFGAQALAPADLALFPSYLICLQEDECGMRDRTMLMEMASSDLPMKILLQTSDALGEPSPIDRQLSYGAFAQLANTFVALGDAYVLQSVSSNLYRNREELRKGMEFRGPAIFSILAYSDEPVTTLPAYLSAASALESRVFPAFSYDPAAGAGLVDRFRIDTNPEVGAAWPRRELCYEDEELQLITEDHAFTLVDLAVTDPRYSDHFVSVSRESWNDNMLPVADYLDLADEDTFEKIPFVPVVDTNNILRRLVVDEKLIRMASRCRDRWHVLQEQGGINNSYASAMLSKERIVWEEEKEKEIQTIRAELAQVDQLKPIETVAVQPVMGDAEAPAPVADEVEPVISDDPYIETPRCTTCDECTNRNDRMFAYDDNKQAFLKDVDAGSYADLVEAAEACQVAIIHPGKPRNEAEPGLEDLMKRAEPFMG